VCPAFSSVFEDLNGKRHRGEPGVKSSQVKSSQVKSSQVNSSSVHVQLYREPAGPIIGRTGKCARAFISPTAFEQDSRRGGEALWEREAARSGSQAQAAASSDVLSRPRGAVRSASGGWRGFAWLLSRPRTFGRRLRVVARLAVSSRSWAGMVVRFVCMIRVPVCPRVNCPVCPRVCPAHPRRLILGFYLFMTLCTT
jgi:hypothetical protein